jgi:RNA polymerase-binding protein DksA
MTDTAQTLLQAQLAELEIRKGHIARDLAEPLNPDFAEQATEAEDDEALEAQGRLIEKEIISVKRALDRIEDGEYGICVRCSGEIAPARLQARPEAALCIHCASKDG